MARGKKKEVGTKQPPLHTIIKGIDDFRDELIAAPSIKSTKFSHMQLALHYAKQIVRRCYGAPLEKGAKALIK